METTRPLVSVILSARNDNHGGNMLHRMNMFTDTLATLCNKHSLPTELVVVDWNPPADKPLMHEALDLPETGRFFSMRFIQVPEEIHKRYEHSDRIKLYQFISKNVGIRRARGEWIIPTNLDILFSDELVRFIAQAKLDPECFYRADRYDTSVEIVPAEVGGEERTRYCLERLLRVHKLTASHEIGEGTDIAPFVDPTDMAQWPGAGFPAPESWICDTPYENGSGDFMLMHRDQWDRLRGYPELQRSDVYIDAVMINLAIAGGVKQVILPYPMTVCHIEHEGSWIRLSKGESTRKSLSLDYETEFKPWCRSIRESGTDQNPNGDDWGLGGMEFSEIVP